VCPSWCVSYHQRVSNYPSHTLAVPCQSYSQTIHLAPSSFWRTHISSTIFLLPILATHISSHSRESERLKSPLVCLLLLLLVREIFPTNNHLLRPKSKPTTTTPPNRHHQSYNQGVLQLSVSRHIINHSHTHSFISNLLSVKRTTARIHPNTKNKWLTLRHPLNSRLSSTIFGCLQRSLCCCSCLVIVLITHYTLTWDLTDIYTHIIDTLVGCFILVTHLPILHHTLTHRERRRSTDWRVDTDTTHFSSPCSSRKKERIRDELKACDKTSTPFDKQPLVATIYPTTITKTHSSPCCFHIQPQTYITICTDQPRYSFLVTSSSSEQTPQGLPSSLPCLSCLTLTNTDLLTPTTNWLTTAI